MKKVFLSFFIFIFYQPCFACITCNKQIQQAIFNSTFYPNLFTMLLAFIVLGIIVFILSIVSTQKHKARVAANTHLLIADPTPLTSAATVLGIGIGGFIDGIVLHQILQWHEMLSNKIPPVTFVTKTVNMFWDGIFHAFSLLTVMVGVFLMWKLLHRKNIDHSGNLISGGLLLGWGLFNLVEGLIDHQILKLHNVREITPNPDIWNYGFLSFAIALIFTGYYFTNKNKNTTPIQDFKTS